MILFQKENIANIMLWKENLNKKKHNCQGRKTASNEHKSEKLFKLI